LTWAVALTTGQHYRAACDVSVTGISVTVTITVNRFDLFPFMVISITVTVNLNHTASRHVQWQAGTQADTLRAKVHV